jgi:drug/metabolite transporter (DMT)-like permease
LNVPTRLIPGLLAFGIFQFAAPFAFLPLAQGQITSSAAGIANAMAPVAVVVISHLWPGGERANKAKLLGVALGVAGISILATRGAETGGSSPGFVLLAVMAPVCYGIALNVVRSFKGVDPVIVITWAMICGAIAIAPVALAVEGVPEMPDVVSAASLVALGLGLTSVTFLVMYSLLPAVGATNLSLVTFVAPISATAIGVSTFGETIGLGHVLGMAFILAGLAAIDGRLSHAIFRHAWFRSSSEIELKRA